MSKKNALSNLLSNAQETEQSFSGKTAVPTTNDIPEELSTGEKEETPDTETSKNNKSRAENKGFNIYLHRRDDKSTEPTRLPAHIHKKLKLIAISSGISLEALVANIIEKTLQENEKEINTYLKKNLGI